MVVNKFTDSVVKSLKPAAKDQDYLEADSMGFGIRVSPTGHKKFFYRYNFHGKRRFLQLGHYKQSGTTTGITLAEARRLYVEARNKVLTGDDPATEKKVLRATKSATPFVADLVDDYIIWLRDTQKRRSWAEVARALRRDFVPAFGPLKITEVTRGDVQRLLELVARRSNKKNSHNSNVMANRLQAYISALLSYAVHKNHIPINYMLRIGKIGGTERAKERNLSFDEIKTFWVEIDTVGLTAVYVLALKLVLLTGQRPSEVCGICRDELDGNWWTIPSTRTKNGLPHRIYLTPLIQEVLRHPWCHGKHYLLSQTRNVDSPITKDVLANQLLDVVDRLTVGKFTAHDLRRTMSTRLAELKVSPDMLDRLQNHISGAKGNIRRTYNPYDYDPQKQQAMLAWDNNLTHILYPGRVTDYPDWYDYHNPEDAGLI